LASAFIERLFGPNVGLGCEHLVAQEIREAIAPRQTSESIVIQDIEVEKRAALGRKIVKEMRENASKFNREPIPLKELILGTECGGRITPRGWPQTGVGAACDMLVTEAEHHLSETPELIGAEHLLRKGENTRGSKSASRSGRLVEKRAIEAGEDIRKVNPSPEILPGASQPRREISRLIYKAVPGPSKKSSPMPPAPRRKVWLHGYPAHDIEQLTGMVAEARKSFSLPLARGTPIGHPSTVIRLQGTETRTSR